MKRLSRNASAHEPVDGVPSGDPLDEEIWRRLGAILAAAKRGDADEFSLLWQGLDREVSDHRRGLAGVYVWYLLQYRVLEMLGRRPTLDDLHEMANWIYPKFAELIRWDQRRLEDMLGTVFGQAPPERQVTGGELYVAGSAAVSVLLDDPASQMETICPPLARWYSRNAQKLKELGVT